MADNLHSKTDALNVPGAQNNIIMSAKGFLLTGGWINRHQTTCIRYRVKCESDDTSIEAENFIYVFPIRDPKEPRRNNADKKCIISPKANNQITAFMSPFSVDYVKWMQFGACDFVSYGNSSQNKAQSLAATKLDIVSCYLVASI